MTVSILIGLALAWALIGLAIAWIVHRAGPPISPRSWLLIVRTWPRLLVIDAVYVRLSAFSRKRRYPWP